MSWSERLGRPALDRRRAGHAFSAIFRRSTHVLREPVAAQVGQTPLTPAKPSCRLIWVYMQNTTASGAGPSGGCGCDASQIGGVTMPRPVKPRWVEFSPGVTYFKPAGVRMRDLEEVVLGLDEVEAIRLKDLIGLDQEQCAERMGIAQSTFQRVLTIARNKIASALIEGKALRVEGGNYLISPLFFTCTKCGSEWKNEDRNLSEPACPECGCKDVVGARVHPDQLQTVGPGGGPGGGRGRRNGHRHGHGHGNGPGRSPGPGFGRRRGP
jgi:predicted DNA-binding protein (UPF0251 family)/DNA-directed RNA polymerase subunit RPC12/RpoP